VNLEKNLVRQARAQLEQARKMLVLADDLCTKLCVGGHSGALTGRFREAAEVLLQSVHEYNATANALELYKDPKKLTQQRENKECDDKETLF
jgi:hypothetical protein